MIPSYDLGRVTCKITKDDDDLACMGIFFFYLFPHHQQHLASLYTLSTRDGVVDLKLPETPLRQTAAKVSAIVNFIMSVFFLNIVKLKMNQI